MSDDLCGVSPVEPYHSAAQSHKTPTKQDTDYNKNSTCYLPISSHPGSEVSQSRSHKHQVTKQRFHSHRSRTGPHQTSMTGRNFTEPSTQPTAERVFFLNHFLCGAAPGSNEQTQPQGHQNPPTHHITSLSPFVAQGFCEFLFAGMPKRISETEDLQ